MFQELERVDLLRLRKILLCSTYFYFFFLFSILVTIIRLAIPKSSNYQEGYQSFTGIVTSKKIEDNKVILYIKNKEIIIGNFEIEKETKIDVEIGDKIQVKGIFERPKKNTNKYLFNYQLYCKRRNIYYVVDIKSIELIHKSHNIYYLIKRIFQNRVGNNAYLNTFLLGDKSYLVDDIKRSYQENGISHLFAISGMHISLLSKIIEKILKKIKVSSNTIFKITSIFLLLYLFLVGFSPSILRGVLFYILFSINQIYYFYIDKKNLFICILSIALLINANSIFDVGFLYSYSVSLALIVSSDILLNKSYYKSLILVSMIAFFIGLPISIYTYYQINLFSLIYNLLFVPFISLFLFPFSLIVFMIKPLLPIFNGITFIMEKVSLLLSTISIGKLIFKRIPFFFYIIYFLLIVTIILFRKKKLLIVFLSMLLIHFFYPFIDNSSYVEVIDVGQGDSSLLHIKNQNILIDTGGLFKRGTVYLNTLEPTFKSMGIHKIHYLILTHGDKDHLGDALYLVNNYRVGEVIFNCGEYNYLEKELIQTLEKEHIKYKNCVNELELKNTTLYFLQTKDFLDENDNSNVIYTEINNYKFMFMGDASIKTEKEIMNTYHLPEIDVLKVGHHGSRTSSGIEFINMIRPKVALISAGKDNKFKHPNQEALDNLNDSKIYRTDLDGSIMIQIKNNQLKIETYSP